MIKNTEKDERNISCIPNETTLEAMREAERIAKDPNVKAYTDIEAFFRDLINEDLDDLEDLEEEKI